ncbi:MAG: polyribonucleotide nucleotidyltransferase [Chlamydiae bacterium]|nr:polyribonucleotide nucleotidyltransferase [Chlamydiota bacterium]
MKHNTLTVAIQGKELVFETGKVARQANGAVMLSSGHTTILATACATKQAGPDVDFFPLRVDYQEKFSSAGKTLGGFLKREGKPTEKEVLVSRLIDRPIRPMFEDGFYNEVQILSYVLSYDENHATEPLAICAASAALVISDIPLIKPVAGVRVGMKNDMFIINPSEAELAGSELDLMLAGTEDAILMIEGYAKFLTEETVLAAIAEGHEAIKTICKALSDWQNVVGKEKMKAELRLPPQELVQSIENMVGEELSACYTIKQKLEREAAIEKVTEKVNAHFLPEGQENAHSPSIVQAAFKKVSSKLMRKVILEKNIRCDGRSTTEIRPISIETSFLGRTHGSTLFTRGETQTIAVCTLGGESMGQRYEDLQGEGLRRFYLQYSFPPFSVGEVGRVGAPGRREVGHGKLAERSLQAILPASEAFPYTIRLESNITESNGSSSMASVCGGCLAMMDAGVPIKRPVAGIAMGLILEEGRFSILSDILGVEDALGDMDFKVAGDQDGITAFQMDIKVEGITLDIMKAALTQAKEGRIHILQKMLDAMPKSRENLSKYAPRIESIQIKQSKIGTVIGPGGKQIRAIIEETGVEIDINDEGIVNISSNNAEALEKAKAIIHNLTAEVEIGKVYKGPVVGIQPFGVFVKLVGGKEGLCHISELSHQRVQNIEDYIKEGDELEVKVLDINDRGQIKLSRKVLLPPPQKKAPSSTEEGQGS